MNKHHRVITIA
jgi:hypothetical protein